MLCGGDLLRNGEDLLEVIDHDIRQLLGGAVAVHHVEEFAGQCIALQHTIDCCCRTDVKAGPVVALHVFELHSQLAARALQMCFRLCTPRRHVPTCSCVVPMQQMLLLALSKHVKELGAAGRVGAAVEQRGSEVAKTYEVASLSFEV